MAKTVKGQRTVYVGYGERVTVQPANDGTDYFYLEVHDGQRNAWTFMSRAKLQQVVGALESSLATTKRRGG